MLFYKTGITISALNILLSSGTVDLEREGAVMVLPKMKSRRALSKDIPSDFIKEFDEAYDVLNISAKASAALSRRCLQRLLRTKANVKAGDLSDEIQQVLDSKQLPQYLADDIDAIRNIGNFAAHPAKSQNTGAIDDVEPGEAEWNLQVLDGLFDFYFIQAAASARKRAALDQKLQAAGKPPMKKP